MDIATNLSRPPTSIARFALTGAVACCLLPLASETAFACPVCYGDLEPEQARGFFWGIIFLMSLPFGLILYIAGHVVYSSRKKEQADRLLDEADGLIRKHLTN